MIRLRDFIVAGISVRTSNKNNQSAFDLSKLWERFYQDEVSGQITDKLSDDIYVVYTDYTSGYTGDYTAIIGHRVSKADNLQTGIIQVSIPAASYEKFEAEGEMPQAIIDTWKFIWTNDARLGRKYSIDLEIYPAAAGSGMANRPIEVYVSVKE